MSCVFSSLAAGDGIALRCLSAEPISPALGKRVRLSGSRGLRDALLCQASNLDA